MTSSSSSPSPTVSLLAGSAKDQVGPLLTETAIVPIALQAIQERGCFSMALSGGSLPNFLKQLPQAFQASNADPQFQHWHILLADERCVPADHEDSNLGALQKILFSQIPQIPTAQIHGIDETLLAATDNATAAIATAYESHVKQVLAQTGGQLDLAVLGFGPDGHTCSLFPEHALVTAPQATSWVAPINDSPKPPPRRITLTLDLLNRHTRHVIFCGAGASKSPILQGVLDKVEEERAKPLPNGDNNNNNKAYRIDMKPPSTALPCGMVAPNSAETENTVTWVVDAAAMEGVPITTTNHNS